MEKIEKLQNQKLTIALHIIFWSVIGLSYILVFWLVFDSGQLILRALVNLSFLAFIFYFNAYILVDKLLERKRYFLFGISAISLVIVFVPIGSFSNLIFPTPSVELQLKGLLFSGLCFQFGHRPFSALLPSLIHGRRNEKRRPLPPDKMRRNCNFYWAQDQPSFLVQYFK
ncbi:MAG: hypothetical protein R2788_03465 [Saprospiraceae bacterium]